MLKVLKLVEKKKDEIDQNEIMRQLQEEGIEDPLVESDLQAFYLLLTVITEGEAHDVTNGSPRNGLEAWRRLRERYDPLTETAKNTSMVRVLRPQPIKNVKQVLAGIDRWED